MTSPILRLLNNPELSDLRVVIVSCACGTHSNCSTASVSGAAMSDVKDADRGLDDDEVEHEEEECKSSKNVITQKTKLDHNEFFVVRSILANASPILKNMLFGNFSEAQGKYVRNIYAKAGDNVTPMVRIDAVTPIGFKVVILHAYGLEFDFAVEELRFVLQAAQFFQMDQLMSQCLLKILPRVTPSNVIFVYKSILDFAGVTPKLVTHSIWKIILENPSDALLGLEMHWDERIFRSFILCDFLCVDEIRLWTLAVNHDLVGQYLHEFRFSTISKDAFLAHVAPHLPGHFLIDFFRHADQIQEQPRRFQVPRFRFYENPTTIEDVPFRILSAPDERAWKLSTSKECTWRIIAANVPHLDIEFEGLFSITEFALTLDNSFRQVMTRISFHVTIEPAISAEGRKSFGQDVSYFFQNTKASGTSGRISIIPPLESLPFHWRWRITFSSFEGPNETPRYSSLPDPVIKSIAFKVRPYSDSSYLDELPHCKEGHTSHVF